jgi:hypothetical protein
MYGISRWVGVAFFIGSNLVYLIGNDPVEAVYLMLGAIFFIIWEAT